MINLTKGQPHKAIAYLADAGTGQDLLGVTPTVTVSKDGGGFAGAAAVPVEIGFGWYSCTLSASDTDTDGPLIWIFSHASAEDAFRDYGYVGTVDAALPADERNRVADSVLTRGLAAAAASPDGNGDTDRSLLWASRRFVNRTKATGTNTIEVYEEDDTAVAYLIDIISVNPDTFLITETDTQ